MCFLLLVIFDPERGVFYKSSFVVNDVVNVSYMLFTFVIFVQGRRGRKGIMCVSVFLTSFNIICIKFRVLCVDIF
jgi:hypothetical protein